MIKCVVLFFSLGANGWAKGDRQQVGNKGKGEAAVNLNHRLVRVHYGC